MLTTQNITNKNEQNIISRNSYSRQAKLEPLVEFDIIQDNIPIKPQKAHRIIKRPKRVQYLSVTPSHQNSSFFQSRLGRSKEKEYSGETHFIKTNSHNVSNYKQNIRKPPIQITSIFAYLYEKNKENMDALLCVTLHEKSPTRNNFRRKSKSQYRDGFPVDEVENLELEKAHQRLNKTIYQKNTNMNLASQNIGKNTNSQDKSIFG